MIITICISFRIDLDLETPPESAKNYLKLREMVYTWSDL